MGSSVFHNGRGRELSPEVGLCLAWLRRAIRLPGAGAWGEEHDTIATHFFSSPDARKLIAYVSVDGSLVLLTPYATLPVAPKVFQYFVKREASATPGSPGDGGGDDGGGGMSHTMMHHGVAPLTLASIRATIQMGFVNGGGVDSLLRLMHDVVLPCVREVNGPTAAWPESLRKDFASQSQR